MTTDVNDQELIIHEVRVTHPTVVALAKSAQDAGTDLDDLVSRLLGLGAEAASVGSAVAGTEKVAAAVDAAQGRMKQMTDQLHDNVRRLIGDIADESGPVVQGVKGSLDELTQNLRTLTAGEDSPVRAAIEKSLDAVKGSIEELVERSQRTVRSEMTELLDPENPRSPLRLLRTGVEEVRARVEDLQGQLRTERAVVESEERGVIGGLDYEAVVVGLVQQIAAVSGDDCEATGAVTGAVPRSKKGDAVADLKNGAQVRARLVIEAKNSALPISQWREEVKGAKENRRADSFLGLCKHLDDMPNGHRLLVLNPHEIVLAFDPDLDDPGLLQLTYNLVKVQALAGSGSLSEVSVPEVRQALTDTVALINKMDSVAKAASQIVNAGTAMRNQIYEIRDTALAHLARAQRALEGETRPYDVTVETDLLDAIDELDALSAPADSDDDV